MNRNVYPLALDDLKTLIETLGFHVQRDDDNRRLTLFLEGDHAKLMVHVIPGGATDEGPDWHVRLLTYSVDFEPLAAGIDRTALLEWLNDRNRQILFGRYYHDPSTDTVAFEVSVPGIGGVVGEDFLRAFWIATGSVDKAHADLKALAPGGPAGPGGDPGAVH